MTYEDGTCRTAVPAALVRAVIASALSALSQRRQQDRARRRTHLLLADLDDQTLDDIGADPSHVRRTRPGAVDWVVQTHSGHGASRLHRPLTTFLRIVRPVRRRRAREVAGARCRRNGRGYSVPATCSGLPRAASSARPSGVSAARKATAFSAPPPPDARLKPDVPVAGAYPRM